MEKNKLIAAEDYEEMLFRHSGLLTVNCKMPVKDRRALSLVYTPGVGSCCKLIEKDSNKAFELTNKKNSILVVSDASNLPPIKNGETKDSLFVYPYVEAVCAYYKTVANIDAYPVIMDFSKIESNEEFQETVKKIMPAFSCVDFLGVDPKRISGFNSDNQFAYIGGFDCRRELDIPEKSISSHFIFAGVIRAALDLQIYSNLNSLFEYIHKFLQSKKDSDNVKPSYSLLTEIVTKSAEFLINHNKLTHVKPKDIRSKFMTYLIEGKKAFIEEYPNNFLTQKRSLNENSILLHRRYAGVIETGVKFDTKEIHLIDQLFSWENLDRISQLILKDPENIYKYTCKKNLATIITNGTAILGFGDIGALAGLPVMEGKCVLFKLFGGTNVIPMCIQERDPDKLIKIVSRISPTFCAINLEDIKAPECFKIESTLIDITPYPVFHDDQHGTAIVVYAGIINALKLAKKKIEEVKIVMNGAGAAGLSVTELLVTNGAKNIIICDTNGAIYTKRPENMNDFKEKLAKLTNLNKEKGKLTEVIRGADIFIGVSAPKTLTKEMIKSMNSNPIIFALANPEPEIYPSEAKEAGALVVATGRSDFANQVNNSLAFPGIFRAVIDTRATKITLQMKSAASKAIAGLIKDEALNSEYIIPDSLDSKVPIAVANAVAKEALESGITKNTNIDQEHVEDNFLGWLLEEKLRNWEEIQKRNLDFSGDDLKPKPKF